MKQKCKNHPSRPALNFCHSCRSFFCSDCLTEDRDYYYCKDEACQRASKENLEQSESIIAGKSYSSGFIKRFFQKRNLTVGWYCFWRSSLLTIAISLLVMGLFYLALIPIVQFFLKGSGGMEFAQRLNAIESINKYFVVGMIGFVIPTLSYNDKEEQGDVDENNHFTSLGNCGRRFLCLGKRD